MKRSMLALLVALSVSLALVGCQNESAQLTGPDNSSGYTPRLIEVPKSAALGKVFTASANITVKDGGVLSLSASDPSDPASICYDITLTFAPGDAPFDFTATLKTDSQNLMYTFGPSPTTFVKPALFNAKFKGLNLNWIKAGDPVYLWYQHANGGWSKMAGTVTYDIQAGTLEATGVGIPHFSRYGFGI